MKISVLAENTTHDPALGSEHGLSLYVETESHKMLFDTGQGSLFAENAVKLGIDLSKVDICFISHGHYDHGGGLRTFLNLNPRSPVYANIKALGEYYANRTDAPKQYIGLDKALPFPERFVFTGRNLAIEDGLELFSIVTGQAFLPSGNHDLFEKNGDAFIPDNFSHEQNLIITEDGKTVLIAGCAHKGIINIVESYHDLKGCYPDYVIGGFHLYNKASGGSEDADTVDAIGRYLLLTGSKYFTCHCTGMESYQSLKNVMADKIDYLSTGNQINI